MNVLVVYCHPNPHSLMAAARDRAVAGLTVAGHEVRLTDLYADGFVPEMTAQERRTHREPGIGPDLQRYADDIVWAEILVLVYPTWWSGMPAMLKGWFDRVWVSGVAWEMGETDRRPTGRLRQIRRLVVVTSHGSSKWVNALEGEAGKRMVFRGFRGMCSRLTRTTWCALYGFDKTDEADRLKFLDRVERTLTRL